MIDLSWFVDQIRSMPTMYYLLRDRLPFFLTLVWVYRYRLKKEHRKFLGASLFGVICVTWLCSLYLMLLGEPLTHLYGIHWTYAAPVEWGFFIIWIYWYLRTCGVESFTSSYIGVIAATGAGWLYETRTWVNQRDIVRFLGLNYHKVFFIDYQVVSILILFLVLFYSREVNYKPSKYLWVSPVGFFIYQYLFEPIIRAPFSVDAGSKVVWTWIIRIPTILYLGYIISGVQRKNG